MLRRLPLCILAALSMRAQSPPASDPTTLQALLSEVRQLRITLEKSALLGPRAQIAFQRIQLQEQKVARLTQQLDDVRKQIAGESAQEAKVAQQFSNIEQELARTTDEQQRKQLEQARDEYKRAVASAGTPDQQLRQRESEIAASLQSEQSVLNELNDKLNAIERLLEPAQPAAVK